MESLSDPSISLDPSNIRGQAYDGASVMSSEKEGGAGEDKRSVR